MIAEVGQVPVRPAATVMLVRDRLAAGDGGHTGRSSGDGGDSSDESGIEVLMVRRAAGAVFAAGMYVFPGGRVETADGDDDVARFVTGLDDAAACALLGVEAGGLAHWVAAIRECFEETGVLLASGGDGDEPDRLAADRRAVHAGELSMAELCRRHGLVLDAGALRYVAHWVTPAGETSRRFDTRFFLAAAPPGQDGAHDEIELVDSRWVSPSAALAAAARGELMMMPPTISNLELVAGCSGVVEALQRAADRGRPRRIEPTIRRQPDGSIVIVSLHGGASDGG